MTLLEFSTSQDGPIFALCARRTFIPVIEKLIDNVDRLKCN